ncbi:hypothetical protein D8B26_007580 [Coccidioides posadasii str. Silveira]|nr:hypothetical protein D8B26_007580 [Coccidioides posadasii str. Silveira]
MYMSRLAAVKEFAFMKALREHGFPVPEPIAQNRHTLVMSLIDAFPLRQIASVPDPASLYSELIDMILRLARYGLIHGDFNEFNILIKEESKKAAKGKQPEGSEIDLDDLQLVPVIIDFPQMVSTDHMNAEMYFDRDVNCIKRYFQRRFGFVSDEPGPFFRDAKKLVGRDGAVRLDVEVEASGFSRKMARDLEAYMKEVGVDGDAGGERGDEGSESELDSDEDYEDEDGGTTLNTREEDDGTQQAPSISKDTPGIDRLRISEPS